MLGYSGGAIATEWAAELAATDAPDVNARMIGAAMRVIAPETSDQAAREALAPIPERANDGTASRRATAAARSVADVAQKLASHEGRDDDHRAAEIMRWCEEAAEQFEAARIQSFVPILVEHIVYNRMFQTRAAEPSPTDNDAGGPRAGDQTALRESRGMP